MAGGLSMRRARADEAERVIQILNEGRASIARLGIEQWGHGYPGIDVVSEDIALGACHVAQDASGELLGTLALRYGRDPDYAASGVGWLTGAAAAGEAPYAAIHRCATARAALRRGVMGFMFQAIEDICRDASRRSVRIDTHPGNVVMRAFLRSRDFTELGPFSLISHDTRADRVRIAYEKLI